MKFVIYKDAKGDWRWRIKSSNGRIVGDSSEGYKNKQDAIDMMKKIVAITSYENEGEYEDWIKTKDHIVWS